MSCDFIIVLWPSAGSLVFLLTLYISTSSNLKVDFPTAADVEGFEDLTPEDQAKFEAAYENGRGTLYNTAYLNVALQAD